MSSTNLNSTKFVCIEYPAVVQNVQTMLDSLGGSKRISQTYQDSTHRLEMRFRTGDPACKPCLADRVHATNLLISVIRKRKKKQDNHDPWQVSVEVLGTIRTCYKFLSMADFQYLPVQKQNDEYKSCLQELAPQKMESCSWIAKEAPLFILPPLFSRMDSVGDYHFRKNPIAKQKKVEHVLNSSSQNLITRMRNRRVAFAQLVTYEDTEVPTKPHEEAWKQFPSTDSNSELLATVQKMFEMRPIWSRNALCGETSLKHSKLKGILPLMAYYFYNGPWRGLWCRFGYDPRIDKDSRNYQLLDFRTRAAHLSKNSSRKRCTSSYNLPNKLAGSAARVATIQKDMLKATDNLEENAYDASVTKDAYYFCPTMLPRFRQMFYQFCDIDVEEVQNMIADEKNHNIQCHERYGWLNEAVHKQTRAIISDYLQKSLHQVEGEREETNISEESESEDEFTELQNAMESELMEYDLD